MTYLMAIKQYINLLLFYLELLSVDKKLSAELYFGESPVVDGMASLLTLFRLAGGSLTNQTKFNLRFNYYSTNPIQTHADLEKTLNCVKQLVDSGDFGYTELLDIADTSFLVVKDCLLESEAVKVDCADIPDKPKSVSLFELLEEVR